MNVDDTSILLATQGTSHGANLFAYCENNPVNQVDYTGYWGEDVHNGFYKDPHDVKVYDAVQVNGGWVPCNLFQKKLFGTYWWALNAGFSHQQAKTIGYTDNAIDSWYSPFKRQYQAYHFNVFANTSIGLDSRILLCIVYMSIASQCFTEARAQKQNSFAFYTVVQSGLSYLGQALHPIQDYYAHTPDMVSYFPSLQMWGHVRNPRLTDDPIKRWGQLLKTEQITTQILTAFFLEYKDIFQDWRVR